MSRDIDLDFYPTNPGFYFQMPARRISFHPKIKFYFLNLSFIPKNNKFNQNLFLFVYLQIYLFIPL